LKSSTKDARWSRKAHRYDSLNAQKTFFWESHEGLIAHNLQQTIQTVLYVMYNRMRFEWDADKERSNRRKHAGIDFETASRVFADPNLLTRKDRVVDGEQRWHAIGAVRKAVVLVVHLYLEENENGEEVIRIISARAADPRECRVYLEQGPY
jgi:uncharacterized DUF497 family protein